MNLDEANERGDVEDRRGSGQSLMVGGGIGALIIGLVATYFGIDPKAVQQFVPGPRAGPNAGAPKDGYVEFSQKLLGTTNRVWRDKFRTEYGRGYTPPTLVLFSDRVDSQGCGIAPSSVGPFYCPVSKKVFLDPSFFDELEHKLGGSKAEFSQAYVIAHEVGHHVQNLLGYNEQEAKFHQREGANAGIRLELQADYLAGVWAHDAQEKFHILSNPSEVQEALKTARAIGDNRIQEKMRGKSWPESFTHGSDEQRYRYFKKGFDTGDASRGTLDKFFDPNVKPLDL
jgi:predicted metalloprotease